jgi:hypothetical protein
MAIIGGQIRCSACNEWKKLKCFQPSIVKRGCGECKPCKYLRKKKDRQKNKLKRNESAKKYRQKKGAKWRREVRKRAYNKNPDRSKCYNLRRYGMTIDEFKSLKKKQKGKCACCGATKNTDGKSLYVDHCHKTGEIRGLLCRKCNTGIGLLGDTVDRLERALKYLKGIS